ncbi:MAG TPA: SCO family protein [Phenylobacterium sp.]|nr:SCO family protein [Phenylobacterium sp.]
MLLQACSEPSHWRVGDDVTGSFPPLAFTLTRATDGKTVTAADYRGKVVLLYFGYTFCPDVCPTTLLNLAQALKQLGPLVNQARVLFITVDPNRDTLPILKDYGAQFAPQIEGMRPTPDQLAGLARRYRAAYSVSPGDKDHPYVVTHSSAVYVFDKHGNARFLLTSMSTGASDTAGAAADLRRLLE